MWFGLVYMWGWAKMAGRRNKNAIKFVLKVLIKSEKNELWISRMWFGVFWGVSMDPA